MKILISLATIYVAFAAIMFVLQRQLQYVPDTRRADPALVGLADFDRIEIETADRERLVSWFAPPRGDMPVIVYFQGNAGSIADRADRFRRFHDSGYGVLAVGYRGYGGSSGRPSEDGLIADGEAALAYLAQKQVPLSRTVLFGESLGSGVAVALAAQHASMAVVLDSPFTSAVDVARRRYWFLPVDLLMRDQFRSLDRVAAIGAPLFIVHGDDDSIIPVEQGRRLFAAAPDPKEMVELPGVGHVTPITDELWARMDAFLRRAGQSG